MTRYLYVGTSTQQDGQTRPEGIFVYRMDPTTAQLEPAHAIVSGPNPSFLAFSPDKRFLFCVNETMDGDASSFAVDLASGNLTFLSRVKVGGDLPCYLSVDPSGRSILIANYWSGSLTVIPVEEDGVLGERVQQLLHQGAAAVPWRKMVSYEEGIGPLCVVTLPDSAAAVPAEVMPDRQEKAHAHSIVFDPTQNFALSADLGMDRVWVYRFENGRLAANAPQGAAARPVEWGEYGWMDLSDNAGQMSETPTEYQRAMGGHNLKPGAGPRHIAFHPNGRFFYVSNELDSTVTSFAWGGEHGYLKPLQNLSTLPADFDGRSDAAHVALTPDGKFLYVSNRGHNSLAIFSVDGETGRLTPAGHTPTMGNWPRNFCIDPEGRFLIAANQFSNDIFVFAIDPTTGALQPTGAWINLGTPYFVTVVDLE